MASKWIGNCWPDQDRLLLLQAAILPAQPAIAAWNAWLARNEATFEVVDPTSYQLYPLVYRNLSKYHVTGPIIDKCKGIYKRNWAFNQTLWSKQLPILNKLKQSGVDKIVLLKGMAMIVGHYHDFGARIIGDVDVLIAKSQLTQACNALKQTRAQIMGAPLDLQNPYDTAIHHAITYELDTETFLDLHWSFLAESPFTGLDEEVMQQALQIQIQDQTFWIPDPTTLFMQTCTHGVKSTTVASLRWIPDSMLLLNTAQIDWDKLLSMAQRAQVCASLARALEYLREKFAAPIPEAIISALSQQSIGWQEKFEYACNVRGYFFIANWLRYCSRRGYHSLFAKLSAFPRFIQHRRRLPHLWQVPDYALRWVLRKIRLTVSNRYA